MTLTSELHWQGEWRVDSDGKTMLHTSIQVTREGMVVSGAATEPRLVFRNPSGVILRAPAVPAIELHGLCLVEEGGEELIWIADTATKVSGGEKETERRRDPGGAKVLQVDLHGTVVRVLPTPPIEAYQSGDYLPTAIAVDERRHGGTGDMWVADGYGAMLVHRFAVDGTYLGNLSGEEGAGRFNQPHDVFINRRGEEPELYVADRKRGRLQIFDLNGRFKRSAGEGHLRGPTQLATRGDALLVTDLLAGALSVLDGEDRFVKNLFAGTKAPGGWDVLPDGWPNRRDAAGRIAASRLLPAEFHAPHGIAVDPAGQVYVNEFAIDSRIVLLSAVA